MSKILIVGGGAAGMMAGIFAARRGNEVVIYEKNEKLGKKLFITGKGRCNITNACDPEIFFENVKSNSKFLYSSFYGFHNYDVIDFFQELGLETKIERGQRVFPQSDKSSDVIGALARELKKNHVKIEYNTVVNRLIIEDHIFKGIEVGPEKHIIDGDAVIVATGGMSYKLTGSTGDGYKFAKEMGHHITELSPSLVAFNIKEEFVKELMGLSLRNIGIRITSGKKEIFHDFGEMIFTHFGVSGPVVLSASRSVIPYLKNQDLEMSIDLKPALSFEQLDNRILRDFDELKNKQFKNSLDHLLPRKLIAVIISLCGISPDKKVNLISKEERSRLVQILKGMKLRISGLRDYNEAIITKGGIDVKEINPATMESKLEQNVYYIGEVLDLDALTGGFNLQIAWSTAFAAGNAV